MKTQEKIQNLEREIRSLWQVIEDERLWHPSVISELRRRSRLAKQAYARGKLQSSENVFAKLSSR